MGLTTRCAHRDRGQLGAIHARPTPREPPETGALNLTAHEIKAFDGPADTAAQEFETPMTVADDTAALRAAWRKAGR